MLTFAAAASAAPSGQPKAFSRPPRAADVLPAGYLTMLPPRLGHIVATRRIATYDGGPKRRARLYLIRTSGGYMCSFLIWRGAGGGCNRGSILGGQQVQVGAGQFLAGVAADRVTRIVVVGSRGVRHRVPLSSDQGFIYDCRAYNGCTCAVARVDAYAGSRRVARDYLLGRSCRKKR